MVDSSSASLSRLVLDPLRSLLSAARARKVLVACSGGSDSVSLALGVRELREELGLRPVIVHVDHALRGRESAGDRRFVEKLGQKLGLPVRVFRRPVRAATGNLEEMARDARYEALYAFARRSGADAVLTGHTLDDQAETVMMNLLRGCGTDGLGGISAARKDSASGVPLIRPLLGLERRQLQAFLKNRGQAFRTDSSNGNDRFLRNYLRIKLFKELDRKAPGFRRRFAQLAQVVREEQPAWEKWLERATASVLKPYRRGQLLDQPRFSRLEIGIQRRLLRQVVGRDLLTFDGVERLRAWMQARPSGGRFFQLRKGWVVERLSKSNGSPSPSLFWFRQLSALSGFPRAKSTKKGL